ncbi:beta-phosphoglucomutase, partial [Enterococcus faecalis]
PVGVGRKEELGEGLPIVPETSALTFDYLKKVWLDHEG